MLALWSFLASTATIQKIVAPALLIGLGFAFGRPSPKVWAYRLITLLPLNTVFVIGVGPAWNVSMRVDDGNRGIRHLSENCVDLTWAPQDPGWPTQGMNWYDAVERCKHLDEGDGISTVSPPQFSIGGSSALSCPFHTVAPWSRRRGWWRDLRPAVGRFGS